MNGVRFECCTYRAPATTNTMSTIPFTSTSAVFASADSLMPMSSSSITRPTTSIAGRLNGACVIPADSGIPRSRNRLTKYPDHPTATVDALKAYSRIRSQPMIHATISPIVAYA
jgi:hypothetical protein